jgi:hypothetical protein
MSSMASLIGYDLADIFQTLSEHRQKYQGYYDGYQRYTLVHNGIGKLATSHNTCQQTASCTLCISHQKVTLS